MNTECLAQEIEVSNTVRETVEQSPLKLSGSHQHYHYILLDVYVEFLRKNHIIPYVDVQIEIFGFALNKTLKQIRNIFHKSLLTFHLERTKNAPELCTRLEIDTRTYFSHQKKLGLRRGDIPQRLPHENPYFSNYIESLSTLSWREANRRFEHDLYEFLLKKHQHNKRKLAEVMGVSYQQVIRKTRWV